MIIGILPDGHIRQIVGTGDPVKAQIMQELGVALEEDLDYYSPRFLTRSKDIPNVLMYGVANVEHSRESFNHIASVLWAGDGFVYGEVVLAMADWDDTIAALGPNEVGRIMQTLEILQKCTGSVEFIEEDKE